MKAIAIAGFAALLAMSSSPVLAKSDSGRAAAGAMKAATGGGRHWSGGARAPGGWNAYRRPHRGYVLPSYWINPAFYIGSYGAFGLPRPSVGYGWSRYYDDAVLTDPYGRVQDWRENYDWDRYGADDGYDEGEDYSDSYGYREGEYRGEPRRAKDRDGGLGGGLIGAAVGGLAGGLIAKKGDNTEGVIAGGLLGAAAGAAIDASDRAGRGPKKLKRGKRDPRIDYDYGREGQWEGTWRGSWDGGPERTWNGTFDGDYRGNGPHGADHGGVHWGERGRHHAPYGRRMVYPGYGYYDWGMPQIITIQSAPVVTTHTTTTYEYVSVASKKQAVRKRVWKPRARKVARCVC